jgi:hypothetical protein
MNTFEIAVQSKKLPKTIDKLVPLSFIGATAVEYYKNQIKLFDNLKMTDEQKRKTLKDGQDAGVMLLEIEKRIGEISETMPSLKKGELEKEAEFFHMKGKSASTKSRTIKAKKLGLKNKSQLKIAQTIKNHPATVKRVIKEAIANDDIPTKTAVVNKIRFEREKKRRKAAEKKKQENKLVIAADEQQYINALERCISIIPRTPPKVWSDEGFALAQGVASVLVKRLKAFDVGRIK